MSLTGIRRGDNRDRHVVAVATAVFFLGLLLATFVNPLFRIPDERFHADLVRLASDTDHLLRDGWPLLGERNIGAAVTKASRHHTPTRAHTGSSAIPRNERAPFSALAQSDVIGPRNRMAQHPPLYYLIVAGGAEFSDLLDPGLFAHDVELWLMRFVNVILLVPLPLLAYLTARRLSNDRAVWLVAAVMPVGIPGLMIRNGPMINNDNLITVLGAVIVYLIVRIVEGDINHRIAAGGGLVCGFAMLTKAFGLVLLVSLGLGYGWVLLRRLRCHESVRPVVTAGVMSGSVALIVGGWWYVRTWIRTGWIRQNLFPPPDNPAFVPDWDYWLGEVLSRSWTSFWGGSYVLGREHGLLLGFLVVLTLAGVVGALVFAPSRDRRSLVVAALLPALTLAVAMYAQQASKYMDGARIGGVQGRYLYAGLTGITSVMGAGFSWALGEARRWLPLAATIGVGVLYTVGFHAMLVDEWGVADSDLAARLLAVLAWSGPAPWFVILTGVGFASAGVWLAWLAMPRANRDVPDRRAISQA